MLIAGTCCTAFLPQEEEEAEPEGDAEEQEEEEPAEDGGEDVPPTISRIAVSTVVSEASPLLSTSYSSTLSASAPNTARTVSFSIQRGGKCSLSSVLCWPRLLRRQLARQARLLLDAPEIVSWKLWLLLLLLCCYFVCVFASDVALPCAHCLAIRMHLSSG